MSEIRLIIFDLDGTLFRPGQMALQALYAALEETARELNTDIRLPGQGEICCNLGHPDYRFIENFDLKRSERLRRTFNRIWSTMIEGGRGDLYDGSKEALQALKDLGFQLALASSLGRDHLLAIMDRFDLDRYIDFAVCIDDIGRGGEEEMLRQIIDNREVLPSEAVYVADREINFFAARQLGITSVGCSWGFGKGPELERADYVVDSFDELIDLLKL